MILLDTHVVLWSLMPRARERVGPRTRQIIDDAGVRYLSAVTHVEVAVKKLLVKLRVPDELPMHAAAAGFTALPFEDRHAQAIHRFPALDRHDPFDRMLVAQADVERLVFITADRVLLDLDQPWIIDATK